jgi:PIN domain nuclease of toxin-antitoxin system
MPYVTDTHALIWHMTTSPNLSLTAKRIFEAADNEEEQIVIPCIVFFELLYLVEKGKIDGDFDHFTRVVTAYSSYQVEPLDLPIIERCQLISRDQVADPWDRIIAATAIHLEFPLISRDRLLHNEDLSKIGLKVVW